MCVLSTLFYLTENLIILFVCFIFMSSTCPGDIVVDDSFLVDGIFPSNLSKGR